MSRSKYFGVSIATVIATLLIVGAINRNKQARRILGTEDNLGT